ncbi:MAG TPA: cysteine--tRNA ligase, partial [Tepidisphaeraceae bacterium]|nr:cysteine--tRNA ligase [Tepidisphaeraceae bacterium]
LSGQKEPFEPIHPGKVGIYLCGPTVYKPPHIGHMVGPIIFDAIKRYLQYKGYEVTWIVNVTDVDDKLIEAAASANSTVIDLATKFTKQYFDCLTTLGVEGIDRFPKASEHMPEIIDICQKLIDSGYAYATEGNVWFDVSKDSDYGKLSHRKVEEQESGTRSLEGSGKRNPADFALWKKAKPGEPQWDSPWGPGRPGWHIECSAMSMKYLGQSFDMHGGGMDLMFPHHENELAQSESATGKPFAKYWMHNGLTRQNTKKMSGSLGNVVSAENLLEDYGPQLVRYMLLSTQYRRPIEFNDEVMQGAKKGLSVFTRLFERIDRLAATVPGIATEMDAASADLLPGEDEHFIRGILTLKMKFLEMMDDDFNTAGAIGVMHEMAGEINSYIEQTKAEQEKSAHFVKIFSAAALSLKKLGLLLGLFREAPRPKAQGGSRALGDQLMELIIQLREQARKNKDFATADAIRDGLAKLGITVEDRPQGTIWRKE